MIIATLEALINVSLAFHITTLCIASLHTVRGIDTGRRTFRDVTILEAGVFIPANIDCRN
jgi:hypothetical protein